jgi:transcriptional regulator with XRE-family HTH domain
LQRRFGAAVRRLRLQARLGQEGLADRAGIHRTHVSLIERGQGMPTLLVIHKLASALGTTMAALLAAAESDAPPAGEGQPSLAAGPRDRPASRAGREEHDSTEDDRPIQAGRNVTARLGALTISARDAVSPHGGRYLSPQEVPMRWVHVAWWPLLPVGLKGKQAWLHAVFCPENRVTFPPVTPSYSWECLERSGSPS